MGTLQEALRSLNKKESIVLTEARVISAKGKDGKPFVIDSEWLDYMSNGYKFVKEILEGKIDGSDCKRYYFNEYRFDENPPADDLEKLICKALKIRLGEMGESVSKRDDIDADRDAKVEKARKTFRRRRDDADADRDYKLKKADLQEESATSELRKDQEWIDYDMEHDHHISKETEKDIEDQGLQIEKDQHGDYEVAAGHYDECMTEAVEEENKISAEDKITGKINGEVVFSGVAKEMFKDDKSLEDFHKTFTFKDGKYTAKEGDDEWEVIVDEKAKVE